MFKKPPFAGFHPFPTLLVFAGIALLSLVVFGILALAIAMLFFGYDLGEGAIQNIQNVSALKLVQGFNTFGLFIVPPVVLAGLVAIHKKQFLGIKQPPSLRSLWIAPLAMVTAQPIINWMAQLNAKMQLPGFLDGLENWMKIAEDEAMRLTEAFMQMEGTGDLLVNLFIVAVLPAIGEELFFRGVLQKQIAKWGRNPHVGIWVAAFFFSFIHMQFYGFLPRMVMGAFLGYLYYWSKSIWLPTLAHFTNNGAAVFIAYLIGKGTIPEEVETAGAENTLFPVVSFLITAGLMFTIWKWNKKEDNVPIGPL